jgi:hypothetical protein
LAYAVSTDGGDYARSRIPMRYSCSSAILSVTFAVRGHAFDRAGITGLQRLLRQDSKALHWKHCASAREMMGNAGGFAYYLNEHRFRSEVQA